MQRMKKKNSREVLSKVCDQFQRVTGESVGVAFTWTGSLDILGPNAIREMIKENKDKVWLSLAIPMKTIKSKQTFIGQRHVRNSS